MGVLGWILLCIVLVIAVLCLVVVGISRLYYKRSVMSTLVERVLSSSGSKKLLLSEEGANEYIRQKSELSRPPYRIPEAVKLEVEAEERQEFGMQVFFLNEKGKSDTLIFYIHGGAYISPPANEHLKLCNRIAKDLDAAVIFPVYSKVPEHTAKDAYEEMMALYLSYAEKFSKIVFMGDSAGGGLALGLAQVLRDTGERQPDQLILLSPWVDVSMDNQEMDEYEKADPMLGIYGLKKVGALWAGKWDVHDPKASPVYGDMSGLCPVTVFVGTREIFYPDIMRLHAKFEEQHATCALHVGQGQNHVYPLYPTPEAAKAVQIIEKAILSGAERKNH